MKQNNLLNPIKGKTKVGSRWLWRNLFGENHAGWATHLTTFGLPAAYRRKQKIKELSLSAWKGIVRFESARHKSQ